MYGYARMGMAIGAVVAMEIAHAAARADRAYEEYPKELLDPYLDVYHGTKELRLLEPAGDPVTWDMVGQFAGRANTLGDLAALRVAEEKRRRRALRRR